MELIGISMQLLQFSIHIFPTFALKSHLMLDYEVFCSLVFLNNDITYLGLRGLALVVNAFI